MKQKKIIISLTIAILIIGVSFVFLNNQNSENIVDTTRVIEEKKDGVTPSAEIEESVNFKIAQAAEVWPKILEATVDPPKVSVGDTQYMSLTVQSPDGIESVKAVIGTDNGTTTVDLEKTGKESSYIPKIQVEENQVVGVYSDEEIEKISKKMEEGLISKAVAQSPEVEVWEGQWEVHDTHTAWYTTEFVAKDNIGNESSVTVDWLDPVCNIPLKEGGTHSITSTCSLASGNGPDGVAKWGSSGGNLSLGTNGNLTIYDTFVVEGSLNLDGGTLTIQDPDGILDLSSTLYIEDSDGDEYHNSNYNQYTSNASGRTERSQINTSNWEDADCDDTASSVWFEGYTDSDGDGYGTGSLICNNGPTNNNDCYDNNANVKPGQSNYYQNGFSASPSWPSDWDWNCSGSLEYREPEYNTSSCYDIVNTNQTLSGTMKYPFYDGSKEYGFNCDATSAVNYRCNITTNTHGTIEMREGSCSNPGSFMSSGWDTTRDVYVH